MILTINEPDVVPSRKGDRLTGNATALMLTTAVTSGLGMVFWAVAARLLPVEAVGRASAEISAATLLAGLAQLNLAAVLTRFVPAAGSRTRWFVLRSYLVTGVLATAATAAFVGLGFGSAYLTGSPAELAAFAVAVLLFLAAPMTDAVLTALRHTKVVLAQNSVFAVAKLGLLPVLGVVPGLGIVGAWVAPQMVLITATILFVFTAAIPRHERTSAGRSELPVRRALWSFVGAEYLKSILTVIAALVMPLFVAQHLGLRAAAYFAVPWLVAAAMTYLHYNVSAAFVVEAQFDPTGYRDLLRRTLVLGSVVTGGATAVLYVAAPRLLGLLGADYAAEGTVLLRLVALAFPFCALNALYAMFAWHEARLWRLTVIQAGNAVLLFAGAALLIDRLGIDGVGIAYLLAQIVLAVGSLPPILRRLRSGPPSPAAEARGEEMSGHDSPAPAGTIVGRASVIMCVYTEDRWEDVVRGIAAAHRQTRLPDELLIVVDHNDDLLRRLRAEYPGLDVQASSGPPGLSGARNSGVAAASGDVLVFLDDDAEPADDWLERLLEPYADPAVLGTGGAAIPRWPGSRPVWLPPEFDWVVGCSYVGLPGDGAQIRNPIGANMSFRRGAFDAAGVFTHGIGRVGRRPLGCEETEFSIRAIRACPGTHVVHVPRAVVRHRVSEDRTRWRYFMRRCLAEGMSKRVVAGLAGAPAALASERRYVARALPAALWRDLRTRGGLLRVGAIAVGLAAATFGYVRAAFAHRGPRPSPA